jgi:hypothetical protein
MGLASQAPSSLWYQQSVSNINNGRTATVTQNNNVTVNATGGSANDFIQAWDNQLYRQHADLQRRGQAAYR